MVSYCTLKSATWRSKMRSKHEFLYRIVVCCSIITLKIRLCHKTLFAETLKVARETLQNGMCLQLGGFHLFSTCSLLHKHCAEDWVHLPLGMRLRLDILR